MNRKGLTKEMVEMKADGKSYAEISKLYGVTRQRIQQKFNPRTKVMKIIAARAKGKCEHCGQFEQFGHYHHKTYNFDILNEPENIEYLCIPCHRHSEKTEYRCLNCNKVIVGKSHKFCSLLCKQAYNSVTHKCSNCQKLFILNSTNKRRIMNSQSGLLFCSKRCQGIYMGNHVGFKTHPENSGSYKAHLNGSKYAPLIPEIIMRLKTEESLHSILNSHNISRGNYILIRNLISQYKSDDTNTAKSIMDKNKLSEIRDLVNPLMK